MMFKNLKQKCRFLAHKFLALLTLNEGYLLSEMNNRYYHSVHSYRNLSVGFSASITPFDIIVDSG